jgi:tRNA 2-thiocytidine biosynthesis protein TtcA
LRRGFLHGYADELNCNKIALGHHRDDLCVTFLMNLFRGAGLKTMAPNVSADAGSKRVIRPLCYAPKSLVELAAEGFDFPPMNRCDYAEQLKTTGDRAKAERLLIELESRFPGAGKQMLRSMSDLRPDHLLDPRFYNL